MADASSNSSDDFALLERWAAGDNSAADQLVRKYVDDLFRFFSGKFSGAVEDLIQDTFLALTGATQRFRGESSFRTFLYATARHVLFTHYRKRRRFENDDELCASAVMDLDPSPSVIMAKRAEERLLLEGLRRISIDDQVIIELYEWETMTGPEVAAVLGITEAAMRSRLYRAKQALKDQIEKIADSPEVLESTMANLEGWAAALRAAGAQGS